MGGGVFYLIKFLLHFIIFLILFCPFQLKAIELSGICNGGNCNLITSYDDVTNSSPFNNNSNKIELKNAHITNFTNTSTIKTYEFSINGSYDGKSYIENFYNYGRIETQNQASLNTTTTGANGGYRNIYNYGFISGYIYLANNETGTMNITNYGTIGGVVQYQNGNNKEITIDNRGTINLFQENNNGKKIHFKSIKSLTIQNYTMQISESASKFNSFDGNATDNSHLVVDNVQSVKFADANAKMILDFGGDFSFNSPYKLDKLIVKADDGTNALKVDFSRLTTKTSLYKLTQSGENFIVSLDAPNSEIGILHKSNIRTMNNFYIISNSMIYPRKYSKSQNLGRKISKNILSLRANPQDLRGNPPYENIVDSTLDSANPLKSYESFAYQNESQNQQTRRIQRQKRNYSHSQRNDNPVILRERSDRRISNNRDSSPTAQNDNKGFSQNLAQNPSDYYFILAPFVNHNLFFESGRYNLSGFDYGFLTAFSGKIAESNSLGAHFIMSYGSLGDSSDKNFHISNLNLNLGLNYKLDLIWDMYLKARGDFFYFLNQVKTLTMRETIKPNNLGFGASVSYGKDFDFKQGGMLGIEGGLDYKALSASKITLNSMSETYKKSLYNVLYVDLGISYTKYFGNFGINANLGIKGNITANQLAKSQIILNNLNRSVDLTLDNDKVLGYANVGVSYVLNARNFDMEFSLAYYGNFGDRIISNGGGFEWRVGW